MQSNDSSKAIPLITHDLQYTLKNIYACGRTFFLGYLNLSINIGKGSGSCLIKSMCIYVIKASLNNVGPAGAMSRARSWILLTIIFNKIS